MKRSPMISNIQVIALLSAACIYSVSATTYPQPNGRKTYADGRTITA